MIYFVQNAEGSRIKIGTTIRLSSRLKQIAKDAGDGLRVMAIIDGGYEMETSLHRKFSHLRIVNEWFEPGDDLLGFIVQEGREWKPGDDRPVNDGTLESVRIDTEVVRLGRIVAQSEGKSIAEYFSDLLAPHVKRDALKLGAKLLKPDPKKD